MIMDRAGWIMSVDHLLEQSNSFRAKGRGWIYPECLSRGEVTSQQSHPC